MTNKIKQNKNMDADKLFTAPHGLKYRLTKEINPEWDKYNQRVASCQLSNAGFIILDNVYKQPIDNEFDLEEIYKQLTNSKQTESIVKMNVDIDALFAKYVTDNGGEPLYVECTIMYLDDKSTHEDIIKLSLDVNDKEDDKIFYYCNSMAEFKSLLTPGGEDFVVTACHSFL